MALLMKSKKGKNRFGGSEPSPCLHCPKATRCPDMWPCAEWVHWCRWIWPMVCEDIKKAIKMLA